MRSTGGKRAVVGAWLSFSAKKKRRAKMTASASIRPTLGADRQWLAGLLLPSACPVRLPAEPLRAYRFGRQRSRAGADRGSIKTGRG